MPWAISNADTDAASARVLANLASRDSEGILLPGDFKVTQLGTPGGGVQISTGAMVLRNVQSPGESYVGLARTVTTQPISPTTSSSRSDLVVARVIDPDFSPWQPYTDPNMIANGPYFEPFVLSAVSPSTVAAGQVVSYSAYALARIDLPTNTTNILNSMIHDLRGLANPRNSTVYQWQSVAAQNRLTTSQTTWVDWPGNSLQVTVPPWATTATVAIRLNGPLGYGFSGGGSADGVDAYMRVNFNGDTSGPVAVFDFNAPTNLAATDAMMVPISMYGNFDCRAVQGETIVVKPQAERYNVGVHSNVLEMDTWHQVEFDIRFSETTI